MKDYSYLIGEKFGLLTVIGQSFERDRLHFSCECGGEKTARLGHVKNGTVKSCGCLLKSTPKIVHGTHLLSKTKEYKSWLSMIDRCFKEWHPAYKRYGGRGISVCKDWADKENGFVNFLFDMGKCGEGNSLERLNNDLGYSKTNCIWADKKTQANNRSSCVYLTHKGETKTMMQWARERGFSSGTIPERLKRGWSVDDAISKPKRQLSVNSKQYA